MKDLIPALRARLELSEADFTHPGDLVYGKNAAIRANENLAPLHEMLLRVVEAAEGLVMIDFIGKTGVARVNVGAVNDIHKSIKALRKEVGE